MQIVRWSLLVGAVLGAMVVASVFSTSNDWPAAVAWADEHVARWQREGRECPVLYGDTTAGSSRAGYLEAAGFAAALPNDRQESLRELVEPAGAAAEPTAAQRLTFDALAPAVQALRDAAHRSGRTSAVAPPASAAGTLDVVAMSAVVDALLLQARLASQRGEPTAAVDALLDGLACGVDFAHGCVPVEVVFGAFTVGRCVDALHDELLSACDRQRLQGLAEALAAADGSLPADGGLLQLCAAGLVHHLRDAPSVSAHELGMASPLLAWRHGFSVRESGKARAAALVALAQRVAAEGGPDEGWPQRRVRLAAAVAEERARNWDLHWSLAHGVLEGEEQLREAAARLRLLRLAVAFQLGSALPALRDPFGEGDLRAEVHGDRATFASGDGAVSRTTVRRR